MLYDSIDPHRRQRIGAAALLAIFLHITTLLVLDKLLNLKLEREVKTIPIILIADRAIESQSSVHAQQQQQAASAARDFITTQDFANHTRTMSEGDARNSDSTLESELSGESASSLPRVTLPKQSQASRAQSAREGLQQIFNRSGKAAQVEQRNTKPELPTLSDYEQKLIRVLSRDTLYDPFHQIILNRNLDRLSFSLELQLFPNGAIKRARVVEKSGIPEVDELAISTAYKASPYPKPPSQDIQKAFRYLIPVEYTTDASRARAREQNNSN